MKYVESLIGADTINTLPVETMNAYRNHGEPEARIEQEIGDARRMLEQLPELSIDIDKALLPGKGRLGNKESDT